MSKADPPTPPNPIASAAAQTGTNVNTAVANSFLNNMNQVTGTGSLDYNVTGNYGWTDPATGQTYNIPRFTATQTLSPQEQAIQGQTEAAKYNMAGIANSQSARMSGILSTPFDPNSGAPAAGNTNRLTGVAPALTSFAGGGPIQSQIGNAGDITRSYGPTDNFSADRQRVEDALMARMDPQLAIEKQGITQSLADQGIRPGSPAYAAAMDNYNRQANDARFAAVGQAGSEQQRMTQEAAAQAAFQNQAQQQQFGELQAGGQFTNAAQAQQFGQNAQQAAFTNAGLAQQLAAGQAGFNAEQAARNQYMQEQYAQRNQPINETTALLSGSQVTPPNFINTAGSQIPTTDIAGLINQNYNQQFGIYQNQQNQTNSLLGGAASLAGKLGGAAIMSDRRAKENIDRIGTVFAASRDGDRDKLPIYRYSYKDDPDSVRHIGPMAQDVEKVEPEAVEEIGGRKYIRPRMVMGSILRAA